MFVDEFSLKKKVENRDDEMSCKRRKTHRLQVLGDD